MLKVKISPETRKLLIGVVAALIIAAGGAAYFNEDFADLLESRQPGLYEVVEVNDGDTITVRSEGRTNTVRLIGVDTPELHHPEKPVQCFAEAARQFTAKLINGYRVRFEADFMDDNRDLYGRLLRYVYLPDGTLVNAEIVKQGYGFAYTHFPFTKLEEMRTYEREAREEKRGLWSGCQLQQTDQGLETVPE